MGVGTLLMVAFDKLMVQLVGSLMLFSVGMSLAFMNTPFGIYMQKTVPTELMGRVSSTKMSLNMMSISLGTVFYSFIHLFSNSFQTEVSSLCLESFWLLSLG